MNNDQDLLNNRRELGRFIQNQRVRVLSLLRRYSLSLEDAEDVYQEACIALYQNICTGRLTNLTAKLSTYFTQICLNQGRKKLRDMPSLTSIDNFEPERLAWLAKDAADSDDPDFETKRREELAHLIYHLPEPCNRILWAYYYDRMSMADIAPLINFRNGDSVKVKKSRCMSDFKSKYNKRLSNLYDIK